MSTCLVIGGNRGIGLELCRQLADRGATVYATSRGDSPELASLGVNLLQGIDVGYPESIDALQRHMSGVTIDLLLNNAGILSSETWDDLDFERIRRQFEINTLGPLRVVSALRDNLKAGSKVAIVTSRVGSIDDNGSGGNYGYRLSKVAANMVGKNLSHDLGKRGIPVILLHPGLVATEMTRYTGISPAQAATGLIQQIDRLTMQTTGSFWHAEGYPLPW